MVIEKTTEKKGESKKPSKADSKKYPTLKIKTDREIATDFAEKVYKKFDRLIKSIVLFGSSMKGTKKTGSDIDIILIIDDATIKFDQKLILWYRENLAKIIKSNPYKKDLHINTVKLSTWWEDLVRGDPTVVNIIRYGDSIIDFGGFFEPLKILLQEGKIRVTPEAMYTMLNRVPMHITRSKLAEISSIEGCYWAMLETAQALLMSINVMPPSPEHVALLLKQHFVDKKLLKLNYVTDLNNVYQLHRKIVHGDVTDLDGKTIDIYQEKADRFFKICLKLINEII
ncbi:hypothetical protein HOD75_00845 [archaeon]|jgi:predicted nucleotidyltransferase/uncharacterized protein (UPF0332 family)|nr:hypothetical protein [archaeon]MBT4241424.1 hypothetical protein [archaeon]MBT4417705.1 hypothetical protein [archaeon]